MKNRIIIFTCIILSSCCLGKNDTYRYVSDDKYPIYDKYDTLIYKSNWNNLDTFIYGGLQKYYDCQSNEDYCNTETCYESLLLSYYNINWPGSDSYVSGTHANGDQGHFVFKGFIGGFFDAKLDTSVIIGDFKYDGVFNPVIKDFMDTHIISAFYCYAYGILQYEYDNGEIWILQRNK